MSYLGKVIGTSLAQSEPSIQRHRETEINRLEIYTTQVGR